MDAWITDDKNDGCSAMIAPADDAPTWRRTAPVPDRRQCLSIISMEPLVFQIIPARQTPTENRPWGQNSPATRHAPRPCWDAHSG